jgi:hypothetical protein
MIHHHGEGGIGSRSLAAPLEELLASSVVRLAVVLFPYLLRLAAFHFAQRARWAAAIRFRAAADITLGFLPSV